MYPQLTTNQYILRQIIPNDQQKVFEGLSHPEVIKYYGVSYNTFEETEVQMKWYDELLKDKTGIWWAICSSRNITELIGACGFYYWKKEHKKIEL